MTYRYRVFALPETEEPPTALVGNVGDVATGSGAIWVKYKDGWRKSIVEQDEYGRPLQRHPTIGRRRLYGAVWKADKKPGSE